MGMYTTLQGTIVFKSEEIAEAFCSEDSKWEKILEITQLDSVKDYIEVPRSNWIPNGEIRYHQGRVVQFDAELKNYSSTIEKFLELLPEIADDWMLEDKYEECSSYTLHRPNAEPVEVNGDNSVDLEYSRKASPVIYPDFDVFNLEILK